MSKYIILGGFAIYWFLLPFAFQFIGIQGIALTDVETLTQLENPTILNVAWIFINWIAFYFKMLTFSLPNAPFVIGLFGWCGVIVTGLAFVSVVRGD